MLNNTSQQTKSASLDDIEREFCANGFMEFGNIIPPEYCETVLKQIKEIQPFGPELFQSQEDFEANPVFKKIHPGAKDYNLMEKLDQDDVRKIEEYPPFVEALEQILGPNYSILLRKVICGIPETWIPEWVLERTRGNAANNMAAYIKSPYRHLTYFYGIDFHQDLIDWPERPGDFITLYIYLHPVGKEDAPLHIMPKSHKFGGTVFPHDLKQDPSDKHKWTYSNGEGRAMECESKMLTGDTGYAALWSAYTLHGTQPDKADNERISLRYLIAKDPDATDTLIDKLQASLDGPLTMATTRIDRDEEGDTQFKQNAINTINTAEDN